MFVNYPFEVSQVKENKKKKKSSWIKVSNYLG